MKNQNQKINTVKLMATILPFFYGPSVLLELEQSGVDQEKAFEYTLRMYYACIGVGARREGTEKISWDNFLNLIDEDEDALKKLDTALSSYLNKEKTETSKN